MADHILDILQNSIKANASDIEFKITEDVKSNEYAVTITDNGEGMSPDVIEKVSSPFYTTRSTRKVGLGLSLLKQNAELTGGNFKIESKLGKGTKVIASFKLNNIDRKPLGDIWDTFYLTMISNSCVNLTYTHKTNSGEFSFNSEEIRSELDGTSLHNREIKEAIIEMIKNNLNEIKTLK